MDRKTGPRIVTALLLIAVFSPAAPSLSETANQPKNSSLSPNAEAALSFLRSRIGPTGLIDSYVEDNTDYAFLYDNALAALAFISAGDMESARKVLDAFQKIPAAPEGGFWHRYDSKTGKPAYGILQTGANSYLLQAMNLYYMRTGDPRYNLLAQQVADFLTTLQDTDGGLFGRPDALWKSTENNLGALFALYNIGKAQNSPVYVEKAQQIYTFLLTKCWDGTRFLQGINDPTIVTDVQALGTIVLGSDYARAAYWAESQTLTTKQDSKGCEITGFGFDKKKDTIWTEGTLQQSMAFLVSGDSGKSKTYKNEVEKLIHPSGALLLASNRGNAGPDWKVGPWQAVAPTAWYVYVSNEDNVFEMEQ